MEIHSPDYRLDGVLAAARQLELELGTYLDRRSTRPDGHGLADRAEAAYAAGHTEAALGLIDCGLRDPVSAPTRARLEHVKGKIQMRTGPVLGAHELLVTEAETVAAADPGRASAMLADAAYAAMLGGDAAGARAAAERSRELASEPAAVASADLALGAALLLAKESAAGERLVRSALRRLKEVPAEPHDVGAETAVVALLWLEEYDAVHHLVELLVGRARRSGESRLSQWLDTSAAVLTALGRWSAAEARSREALRLAREHGQRHQAASCLTTLAWLAARRGRESECRRLVDQALAVEERGDLVVAWAEGSLGVLELGLGRLDAAIERLEAIVSSTTPPLAGDPSATYAFTHLVEAYLGSGRRAEAAEALARLEDHTRDSRRPSFAAMTARSRGLVSPSDEFERHFEIALEHHRNSPNPFLRAHTELAFGARLRRARRRADARTHLRAALATFEQLGAAPWADRARRELGAASGRSTPTSTDITELLTPQELAVATLVARGLRNDDVAAALYVTRRAVEYHLTNIYRKLEITSRSQLARRLTAG